MGLYLAERGSAMRVTLRILALISLAVLGIALFFDISSYRSNPCPRMFLFKSSLVFFGVFGLLPTVTGSAVAAWFTVAHRRWGWLASLIVALCADLAFLYGAALDSPPPVVLAIITTLSGTFDQALGLTACGSQSALLVQAVTVMLVLLVASLTLLTYSFFGFPTTPETT
jgi:hypothetical protein